MKKNPLPDSVFASTKPAPPEEEQKNNQEDKNSPEKIETSKQRKNAPLMVRMDDPSLLVRLKIFCAKKHRTIKDVVQDAIGKYISQIGEE